jgi:hypothetical protein
MQPAVRDALIIFMAATAQAQPEATKAARRAGLELVDAVAQCRPSTHAASNQSEHGHGFVCDCCGETSPPKLSGGSKLSKGPRERCFTHRAGLLTTQRSSEAPRRRLHCPLPGPTRSYFLRLPPAPKARGLSFEQAAPRPTGSLGRPDDLRLPRDIANSHLISLISPCCARHLDDLAPFLGLLGDELGVLGGRTGRRSCAQFGNSEMPPATCSTPEIHWVFMGGQRCGVG